MITRIINTAQGDIASRTKLVNRERLQKAENLQSSETDGKADFSKILFDAFREQNRIMYGRGVAVASTATTGGHVDWSGDVTEFDAIFEQAANTYHVPLALLKAVARAESNFNPNDVSSTGAVGIMQLMPGTARELGVTDSYDPEQNIMGGAKYIADKLAMYNGNIELALAAYNAGSGNVAKYGGIPPFEETQTYVKRVISYMENYNG
ncbi:MAG: lytic transglycosylase domain-containing protein [Acetatifactor sp.]|nr:lytic transglycosylase domain-containing protein [Acetatifactor sp.]